MLKTFSIAAMGLAALVLAGCAQTTAGGGHGGATAAAANEVALTARGGFEGRSKHVTTGHAAIGRQGGQWVVVLEQDFQFDGAPDPHVALGSDGYRKDAALAKLQSNDGRQVYVIPASLDVADFNEVWIWCDEFAVPLGVAKLTLL